MHDSICKSDAVKACSKCGETKSVSEFHKSGYTKKDGTQSLDSWCAVCRNEYQKRYPGRQAKYNAKPGNKEKISTRMKKVYDADPEKFREKSRKWREDHKEELKANYRKWRKNKDRFLIALQSSARAAKNGNYEPCSATRDEIAAAFTGKCRICGTPELEMNKKLCMDHDHRNGNFRGWICRKCNTALGLFSDSEEILVDALHYLMNPVEQ